VPGPRAYPAPLVLPGDDLALDPHYPPQSLRTWLRGRDRNKVTPERRTVYVVAPPGAGDDVEFVSGWGRPRTGGGEGEGDVSLPDVSDVIRYLQAFYHGLPVKLLPESGLKFASWDDDSAPEPASKRAGERMGTATSKAKSKAKPSRPKATTPPFIALNTTTESIRIRTRSLPTTAPFPAQLNLNDLLDAAIALLPDDAYALLLLVEQDLYEDEDDEFVCGRAYGGSRVAVVSCARYAPALDAMQGVDRAHAWPASCCAAYIAEQCADGESQTPAKSRGGRGLGSKSRDGGHSEVELPHLAHPDDAHHDSPMHAAISAHLSLPDVGGPEPSSPAAAPTGLWLSRVCKTASHELGHCFGIDHCAYYACVMQGSASLAEDARQPPYACPVDEGKLGRAVAEAAGGREGEEWMGVWGRERRERLRGFCGEMERRRGESHLFAALRGWLVALEGKGLGMIDG
jgi:archaemetzincin